MNWTEEIENLARITNVNECESAEDCMIRLEEAHSIINELLHQIEQGQKYKVEKEY